MSSRRRAVRDERGGWDVLPVDRSGRYLAAAVVFTSVALIGAVLIIVTRHDAVGLALLLSGDALTVLTGVDYVRRPSEPGGPGGCSPSH